MPIRSVGSWTERQLTMTDDPSDTPKRKRNTHTAAPWRVRRLMTGRTGCWTVNAIDLRDNDVPIASLTYVDAGAGFDAARCESDAYLMAAAPDLWAACAQLIEAAAWLVDRHAVDYEISEDDWAYLARAVARGERSIDHVHPLETLPTE